MLRTLIEGLGHDVAEGEENVISMHADKSLPDDSEGMLESARDIDAMSETESVAESTMEDLVNEMQLEQGILRARAEVGKEEEEEEEEEKKRRDGDYEA